MAFEKERKKGKKKNTLRQISKNTNSAKPWNPSPLLLSISSTSSVCLFRKSGVQAFILTLLIIMS